MRLPLPVPIAIALAMSALVTLGCDEDAGERDMLIDWMTGRSWQSGKTGLHSACWTFSPDGVVVVSTLTDKADGVYRRAVWEGVYLVSDRRNADGSFDVPCRFTTEEVSWLDGTRASGRSPILETRVLSVARGEKGSLLLDGAPYFRAPDGR